MLMENLIRGEHGDKSVAGAHPVQTDDGRLTAVSTDIPTSIMTKRALP